MSKIELNTSIADYGFSQINANFQLIEDELNQKVLYRDNPVGEPNTIENQIDANDNNIINVNDLRVDNEIYLKGETISQAIDTAAGGVSASAAASATAAAASATQSSTSASNSAASAASAANSFDSFDDRYLGAKSSPPTLDNDGNPLLIGALYWDTTLSPGGTFPATDITVTPAGDIGSTTVQAALQELDTEKANIASPTFTGTVTIPGGTINSSVIGGITPAAGTFTTLRGNSLAKVFANSPTGQTVANATVVPITNWVEITDTSSSFVPTTGIFTAPRTGFYLFTAAISLNSVTWGIGGTASCIVYKNGAVLTQSLWSAQAATSLAPFVPPVSIVVSLTAGDTLQVATFQNSGSSTTTTTASTNNFVTITELP